MALNRMSPLEIFIGTWNTTGDVLATENAPASTLIATDIYRWLPGKHFIIHEADARFGNSPARSMEVIGYEAVSKKYTARSYDDQGATDLFEVALKERSWNIIGDSMRFGGKFDTKGNKLTGLWELKSKQGKWQPWIKLRLERA